MQEKENQTDNNSDVLIVGAGIAGLSTAIKLATHFPESRITLISKDSQVNRIPVMHKVA
jgi:L-2-hydroxyglutarate oxidase LhgO